MNEDHKELYSLLEEDVLPALINRNTGALNTLRIWCAGCSTGQEPYSIAILLQEILGSELLIPLIKEIDEFHKKQPKVEVKAKETELNIDKAKWQKTE